MAVNNKLIYENQCGNVGIGTDAPNAPLDISKTQTLGYSETTDQRNSARLIVRNSDETAEDFSSISFVTGGSNQAEWSINSIYKSAYSGDLAFKTRTGGSSWSERMRIKNNGRVGIGLGNASPTEILEINGALKSNTFAQNWAYCATFIDRNVDATRIVAGAAGSQSSCITFHTYNSGTHDCRMVIKNDGKVGIGEPSPASLLTLKGGNILLEYNSTVADDGHGIFFHTTTSGWSEAGAHAAIYGKRVDASNGYLRFDTRSGGTTTERLRINEDGQFRLGTNSWPTSTIGDVAGRHMIGGDASADNVLLMWNCSTPAANNGSVIYLGARTGQGATTFGGSAICSKLVDATNYSANMSFTTACSSGTMHEAMRIHTDRRVSILTCSSQSSPTSSPSYNSLSISNEHTSGHWAGISFQDGVAEPASAIIQACLVDHVNNYAHLHFKTRNSTDFNTRFYIDSNGNMSMGAEISSFRLAVHGIPGTDGDFNGYTGTSTNTYRPKSYAADLMVCRPYTGSSAGGNTLRGHMAFGDGIGIYSVNPNTGGSSLYGDIRFYTSVFGAGSSYCAIDRMKITCNGEVCVTGIMCAGTCFHSGIVCGSTYLASPYSSVSCAYSNVCLRTDGVFCIKGDDILFCEAAVNKDRFITIGPNATWCGCLVIGSGAYPGDAVTRSHIFVTNGNIHIDSANSCLGNPVYTYLQWHAGCATIFGNGDCAQIGCIGCAGNLCTSSCVHSPVLCAGTRVNVGATACIETGWFRNVNNNTGLYNVANALHWYTCLACEWKIQTSAPASQINMGVCKDATSTCITAGYVYANNSCEIMFLNNSHVRVLAACPNCHSATACTHCAKISCGTTCVISPIVCGTACVKGVISCSSTCSISPIVCGTSCVTTPVLCGTTCVQSPYMFATCFCGTSCVKGVITCGVTCVVSPIVCASTAFCGPSAKITCLEGSAQAATAVCRSDDRCVCATGYTAGKLYFGFGSYDNDNASNWADWLLLSSYTDSSGGNINFLTINRNGFGMRLYQRGWANSSTPSSTAFGTDNYVEMIHSGNISSYATGTTINNNADNRVITGSGTADTLNGEANMTFDGSTLNVTGAITATGDITSTSDCRVKSDINSIDCAIFIVNGLCGRRYIKDDKKAVGVIAQEVEKVLPEVVHSGESESDMKSVSYGNITAVLIEAIKEQQKEINVLRKELDFLKSSKEE